MTPYPRLAVAALVAAAALTACAEPPVAPSGEAAGAPLARAANLPDLAKAKAAEQASATEESALDSKLFYQLLVGELQARGGDPGTGFSMLLGAARETGDERLYQRATDIALQARSGESALRAARAWSEAYPQSRDANRYLLQILVLLNRLDESIQPLTDAIRFAPPEQRAPVLLAVPRAYSRALDKPRAAAVVEQALKPWLDDPAIGADSWVAIGRLRLAASDSDGALAAAERAQALQPAAAGPALLALELLGSRTERAEKVVQRYLAGKPEPEVRMGYARALLDAQRFADASRELRAVTAERPDFAPGWLLRGALQAQDDELDAAQASLERFLTLADAEPDSQQRTASRAQAYLTLSQIAEKRRDYAAAQGWLDRIPDSDQLLAAQLRRASLLARQGKLDDARQLLRGLPGRTAEESRAKLLAEVQLLRDNKRYREAHELLAKAIKDAPDPTELLYDQAMLAEKLGRTDEMEQLLRRLIAAKPDFHHAYNALGYSLADRNVRLDEARRLIEKALSLAPGDPFINDSLGWVEFRAGNLDRAEKILADAYRSKPDADIAAHYGEVLWNLGKRDLANEIWQQGLQANPDSETLRETVRRLRGTL